MIKKVGRTKRKDLNLLLLSFCESIIKKNINDERRSRKLIAALKVKNELLDYKKNRIVL